MNVLLQKLTFYILDAIKTFQNQKGEFLVAFVAVLSVTYSFLVVIDFLPEKPASDSQSSTTNIAEAASFEQGENYSAIQDNDGDLIILSNETEDNEVEEEIHNIDSETFLSSVDNQASITIEHILPVEIHIDRLNRTIPVLNPVSRAIEDLDRALLSGAVRHPDSADFEREGNIFILGHSSRLPNVINRNFQAFNGIENLKWGDVIRVRSYDTEYIYRVDRVYEAKASEVTIPIAGTGPRLTLVTCDNLGAIEDRFILEATLHSQRPI